MTGLADRLRQIAEGTTGGPWRYDREARKFRGAGDKLVAEGMGYDELWTAICIDEGLAKR